MKVTRCIGFPIHLIFVSNEQLFNMLLRGVDFANSSFPLSL
ncbi:hypothetical protein HMPREF1869_00906 [Bacteroidales bacterium KA00251]|nr:hypothetical protein HMPREF1869_00906 [Bacteroidales bacterium KA00251]